VGRNLGQSPAARRIRCHDELGAIGELLQTDGGARALRGSLTQRASNKPEDPGLRFDRLCGAAGKTMAQHCRERLRARIEWQPLPFEREHTSGAQLFLGGELAQQRFRHRKRQTRIAPCERVTDPIAFLFVEEKHLIRFGDGIIAAQMTHVYAAVRKDQMGDLGPLFGASMLAPGRAEDVPKNHGLRAQEGSDRKLLCHRMPLLRKILPAALVRLPGRPGQRSSLAAAERLTTSCTVDAFDSCMHIHVISRTMKLQSLPCYCATLRQAARAVTVLYEEVVGDSGLHATQYTALQIIELAPNLTTTELAQAIGIDQTTATRTLALIKKGGLATDTVGSDRRQRHWVLTPKGQAQLRRLRPKWEAAQEAFEKRLGRTEAAALKKAAYLAASKLSAQ